MGSGWFLKSENWRNAGLTAALVLSPVLAITALVAARGHLADLESQIGAQLEAATRLEQAAAAARTSLATLETQGSQISSSDFLAGTDVPLIAAELQNRLRTLAQDNNIEMNSAYVLPVKASGANQYIGVRVLLRGEIADMQRVLHVVETGAPLLFVERATLRIDSWPLNSADPTQSGAPALVAELDIFGARLPDTGIKGPSRASARQAQQPDGIAAETPVAEVVGEARKQGATRR
jgi:hypothetical protein